MLDKVFSTKDESREFGWAMGKMISVVVDDRVIDLAALRGTVTVHQIERN